jgi:hypothetical protein
MTGIWTSVPGH